MHEHQLLADVEAALQQLRLDAGELRIAFEQRLQAGGILLPQRLPERDRLVGGLELAVDRRLRLAGITARELGMQVGDLVAQHFGDRRPLARREVGRGQRAELAEHGFVDCATFVSGSAFAQRFAPSASANASGGRPGVADLAAASGAGIAPAITGEVESFIGGSHDRAAREGHRRAGRHRRL